MRRVLILEDEANIRSFVVINLKRAGYEVVEAASGYEALELLQSYPDIGVAILDVMLPDIDGFEVCRRIRASGMKIGVLMLTARSQETDKINGLMNGADDYVTKPFSPAELIARIDALFRRIGFADQENASDIVVRGPFELNIRAHTLQKNGINIRLTQVEFAIIKLFLQNPGKHMTRETVLELVWGSGYNGDPKIVDVNIRRLRIKIEDNTNNPQFIQTVWGQGYKWGV